MEYSHLPDLKGLAALRAIVELGGVEQAARYLHIGQPAVTKRLRSLDNRTLRVIESVKQPTTDGSGD